MRLSQIDVLRGVAAVMVTLFHLTGSTALKASLGSYMHYGFLGVQIFFIISGFVLPYSMFKSNYTIANFTSFMVSRIIRIYPAYIASIAIGLIMATLTHRNIFTTKEVLAHLLFLNNSVSPVFWTLAIEFQFYLLIGLAPFFFSANKWASFAVVMLTASSLYVSQVSLIFHWLPFFTLGILIFNKQFNGLSKVLYWLFTLIILLIIIKIHGVVFAGISIVTVLAILYIRINESKNTGRLLIWFGTISYSLYLTHWELGRVAVSIARRLPLIGNNALMNLLFGFLVSILTGWLLYKLIERPSILLSKKYKHSRIKAA